MINNETLPARNIAKNWWLHKRLKYNKGLVFSGLIAFILYCIAGEYIIAPNEEYEITLFTIFFQGIIYLAIMCIANVFYTLGCVVDISFNKSNSQIFRERLFALGYWFSFSLPILLILSVMIRFLIWGK